MAHTFTGDPTVGFSPANPPDPGVPPILTLPDNGDALTADSIYQALKQLADEAAWERLPRAEGGDAGGGNVKEYLTERLIGRFAIDKNGFPGGKFTYLKENWDSADMAPQSAIAGVAAWGGRWMFNISGPPASAGALQVGDPTAVTRAPTARMRTCVSGTTGGSMSVVGLETAVPLIKVDDDTAVSFNFDFSPTVITVGSVELAMGLSAQRQTGTTLWSASNNEGAAFVLRTGDTHFQCYAKKVGSAQTYTDSGLAPGATTRFRARIVVLGANESADSTARVLFYLMGSLKANVAIDISNAGSTTWLMPFFRIAANDVAQEVNIGNVDLGATTWAAGPSF